MTAVKWHEDRVGALDTETTGTDPETARIVTAAVVHMQPGHRPRPMRWLIDPGVDIPAEATEVHGYTRDAILEKVGRPGWALASRPDSTGHMVTRRMPADAAVFEIVAQAGGLIARRQALIVHNAAYDLTLLDHEATRHQVDPLSVRGDITGVVDPMVIEKQYDVFRKTCYKAPGCDFETRHHECGGCRGGKTKCGGCGATDRTLSSLCQHYGVAHAGAHDAAGDAIASVRLLYKLLAAWPQVASWKLATLHEHQITWKREQSNSLRDFWKKVGNEKWREVCGEWPLHTACTPALVGGA